ncbi:CPBP family glutamic-type intramembrane protease [Mucilaginibacter sp. X5P1]|uniref:CPBP family glutamic-type intramembrane protease n=1 Tax=Mucilaginibacter sp. X5P1 TaxID=2723088 RepID=UPI00161044F3|nr:CPBP family glutamic-type intramembrane protease [Mucilaginibacter sp. X5P1]MBB6137728.1 hypothetical protein [Mucilaginibacter sp. X5P1]
MLEEIFAISNYPDLDQKQTFSTKLSTLLKTYGILLLAIFLAVPVMLVADKLVTNVFHHKSLASANKFALHAMFHKLGFLKSFLLACIVAPVFEEVICRLPLSFKKRDIAIGLSIAAFYFSGAFFHPANILVKLGIEAAIAVIIAGLCFKFIPATVVLISPANKKRWIIFFISFFGLMHILNFHPIDYFLIWIYPVFVIPQLLMGWGMSYIRFKNGFVWGIALHMLINTVTVLLTFH